MIAVLTLLIAGLAALVSFIPSIGKPYDNSNRVRGFKRMRPKGWWMAGLTALILLLTYVQYELNEKQQDEKESKLKQSFDSSLTAISQLSALNNRQTIVAVAKTQSDALGKYGYKLDSTRNILVKVVRDSSKTKVIVTDDPILTLCNGEEITKTSQRNDTSSYQINFCSRMASSAGFKIDTYCVLADSIQKSFFYIGKFNFLPSFLTMVKNEGTSQIFHIITNAPHTHICLYSIGTYTNTDQTKKFNIDIVYYYNLATKHTGILLGLDRQSVIDFVLKNKSTNRTVQQRSF